MENNQDKTKQYQQDASDLAQEILDKFVAYIECHSDHMLVAASFAFVIDNLFCWYVNNFYHVNEELIDKMFAKIKMNALGGWTH